MATDYLRRLRSAFGVVLVSFSALVLLAALLPLNVGASSTGQSAEIDQCTNGQVSPLTPQPCLGSTITGVSVKITGISGGNLTSYKNWVNGNSNGSKSHWRESEFIAYRTILSGLSKGPHSLVITYDTVHSGGHALDYIGSYDATETTSPTTTSSGSTIIHANNNSPCADLVSAGLMPQAQCGTAYNTSGVQTAQASPAATAAAPSENFGSGSGGEQGCGGSHGSFTGSQTGGTIDFFGPVVTNGNPGAPAATITIDNAPSGTGQCTTTVSLAWTTTAALTSSQDMVITWGGHIASQTNWGVGNSASFISGSPFHTSLVSLDGASTGSQDRALATSAIFFTPSISTTLHNNADNSVIANNSTVGLGTSVYDSATLTGAASTAGGTATYSFFKNGSCSGTAFSTQTVNVSGGTVPNSNATGSLSAGSYSFQATYSGDSIDVAPPASGCEPFNVGAVTTTTATTLHNNADNSTIAVGSTVPLGTSVYDSATVGDQVGSLVITGTVTYSFFNNGSCNAPAASTQTVTMSGGTVPNSSATGALSAGSYAFQAVYNGDANYGTSTSTCENFIVGTSTPTPATTLKNAADNSTIAVGGAVALGTSVYDTATVSPEIDSKVITGTVTYDFFKNNDCSGTPFSTEPKTMSGGLVPNSSATGALGAGNYAFQAVYSGDSNYIGSTSSCENFTVNQAGTSTATILKNAGDNSTIAVGASVPPNTSVYDTSTVGTQVGSLVISGTVTYSFFPNGTCTAPASGTPQVVTIDGTGNVPNSSATGALAAGSYAFQAVYSGDVNYTGSTSSCENFTVSKVSPNASTAQDLIPNDNFTLTGGAAGDGTGTIDFYLFAPGTTCSVANEGLAALHQQVSEKGAGTDPSGTYSTTNSTFHATTTGTWTWLVVYSGDNNNNGTASSCVESFTISNS